MRARAVASTLLQEAHALAYLHSHAAQGLPEPRAALSLARFDVLPVPGFLTPDTFRSFSL